MKKLLLILSLLINSASPFILVSSNLYGAKTISDPAGTAGKSEHLKEVAESANWMVETAPIVIAIGLLVTAAVFLVRAQYVMAILIFLGGLLAAGAIKIVTAISV